jgi:hypothetical protein
MKKTEHQQPTNSSSSLPPIKDWASVPKLPPDHWIYKGGPQMTFVGGLGPSTEPSPTEDSEVPTQDPASSSELPGFPNLSHHSTDQ